MGEGFDENDLEALRKLRPKKGRSYIERIEEERNAIDHLDGRRLRAAREVGAPRLMPMNVRVRVEIKEMVVEIVRHNRSTITVVVETAVENLHAATFKP
jgi:hypothetical protein